MAIPPRLTNQCDRIIYEKFLIINKEEEGMIREDFSNHKKSSNRRRHVTLQKNLASYREKYLLLTGAL